MQRDVEKYLIDISTAAHDIQQFIGAMSFDEYHAHKLIKAAVERKLGCRQKQIAVVDRRC